jgi:hypothetical protein
MRGLKSFRQPQWFLSSHPVFFIRRFWHDSDMILKEWTRTFSSSWSYSTSWLSQTNTNFKLASFQATANLPQDSITNSTSPHLNQSISTTHNPPHPTTIHFSCSFPAHFHFSSLPTSRFFPLSHQKWKWVRKLIVNRNIERGSPKIR